MSNDVARYWQDVPRRRMELRIPGAPIPKGRPRFGNGRAFTPERTREYEDTVAWIARSGQGRFTKDDRLRVVITVTTTAPQGDWTQDVDNLAKALLDGLQKGLAFPDDSQIDELHIFRVAGPADFANVVIEEIQ